MGDCRDRETWYSDKNMRGQKKRRRGTGAEEPREKWVTVRRKKSARKERAREWAGMQDKTVEAEMRVYKGRQMAG